MPPPNALFALAMVVGGALVLPFALAFLRTFRLRQVRFVPAWRRSLRQISGYREEK